MYGKFHSTYPQGAVVGVIANARHMFWSYRIYDKAGETDLLSMLKRMAPLSLVLGSSASVATTLTTAEFNAVSSARETLRTEMTTFKREWGLHTTYRVYVVCVGGD